MRKLAISGLVIAAAVAAVAISVATSQAKWPILGETAINTRRLCRDGLTYTWASGQTDIQPPATRPVGQPRWVGPIDLLIQSGPSTLPPDEADWENQPMAGGDVFTAGYAPVKNPPRLPPRGTRTAIPAPCRSEPRRRRRAISSGRDTQPNGNTASELFATQPRYLFGPIDVAPGDPTTAVDLTPAAKVTPVGMPFTPTSTRPPPVSTVLFGVTGTEASPTASTLTDLNRDDRKTTSRPSRRARPGTTRRHPLASQCDR